MEFVIYGLILLCKCLFILSCVVVLIGGGIIGFVGIKMYMMGGMGLFLILVVINFKIGVDGFVYGLIIVMAIVVVFGFVL